MWMLTGDKGETAKNIAISCGLIDEELNSPVTIDGVDKDTLTKQFTSAQSNKVDFHSLNKVSDAPESDMT